MLHLLTDEHRKKVVIEYRKRVVIVFLLGILSIVVVSIIFFLPTFFLSYGKYSYTLEEKVSLDGQLAARDEVGSSENIKSTALSIQALRMFEGQKGVSFVLDSIVRSKPAGVQLRNLIFTPGEAVSMTVDLGGKADTRRSLVQFEQKLKASKIFDDVLIPLGSFAKEKNIDFSLKLIVSTTTLSIKK